MTVQTMKVTFSFTKLPVNTYWKDISSPTYSHSRPETIFHFDGTTLTAYEYGTVISKQKYSINEHSIILEPTRTQKQNFEHSGETTIEYKSDVIEDYSLSDNLLLINHIVSVYNMPHIHWILKILFTGEYLFKLMKKLQKTSLMKSTETVKNFV